MSTLLTVGNSEGQRRCDERCYAAHDDRCACVCRGKNHGVGLQQARANTKRYAKSMLRRAAREGSASAAAIVQELGIG